MRDSPSALADKLIMRVTTPSLMIVSLYFVTFLQILPEHIFASPCGVSSAFIAK